ncbi:MAG: KxYKxGKxW signal peptide domain-containing protein [Streptococcaceae bacterium]|jgi:hypothetical protein|nr:KxYKxGKxW signal peptide domain-containing protein [Streptococcaceae bacterium]
MKKKIVHVEIAGIRENQADTVSHFRTWKKGKSWIFGSGLVLALTATGFGAEIVKADSVPISAAVITPASQAASSAVSSVAASPSQVSDSAVATTSSESLSVSSASALSVATSQVTSSNSAASADSVAAVDSGIIVASVSASMSEAAVSATGQEISSATLALSASAQTPAPKIRTRMMVAAPAAATPVTDNSYYLSNNNSQAYTSTNIVTVFNEFGNINSLSSPHWALGQWSVATTLPAGTVLDSSKSISFQASTNGVSLDGPVLSNAGFDTSVVANADGTTTITSTINMTGVAEYGTWADAHYNSTVWGGGAFIWRNIPILFAANQANNANTGNPAANIYAINSKFTSASFFTPNNPTYLYTQENLYKTTVNVDNSGNPLTLADLNSGNYSYKTTTQTVDNAPGTFFFFGDITQGTTTSKTAFTLFSYPGDSVAVKVDTYRTATGTYQPLSGSLTVGSNGYLNINLPLGYLLYDGATLTATSRDSGKTLTTVWNTAYINDGKTINPLATIHVTNTWVLKTYTVTLSTYTQTIHYVDTQGNSLAADVSQAVTLARVTSDQTGAVTDYYQLGNHATDLVTSADGTLAAPWTSTEHLFDAVENPLPLGYSWQSSTVATDGASQTSAQLLADREITIIYSADSQKVTYTVIDDTTGQTLELAQLLATGSSGARLSAADLASYQAIQAAYVGQGYQIVSADSLPASFDYDDGVAQNVVLHLVKIAAPIVLIPAQPIAPEKPSVPPVSQVLVTPETPETPVEVEAPKLKVQTRQLASHAQLPETSDKENSLALSGFVTLGTAAGLLVYEGNFKTRDALKKKRSKSK